MCFQDIYDMSKGQCVNLYTYKSVHYDTRVDMNHEDICGSQFRVSYSIIGLVSELQME